MRRFITLLVVIALAPSAALCQRGLPLKFYTVPASPTTLGQQVRLSVRPPVAGTVYRYIASMSVTGSSMLALGTPCSAPQTLGSGPIITWTPPSGAYRVTVHATRKLAVPEATSVNYQVDAPNGGFLNVSLTQYPNDPPGKLTLSLRTNDRGPGHRYQWVMRFSPASASAPVPPVYRTGETPLPLYAVPFVVQPGMYNISVSVGIHSGDPCRINETSRGSLNNRVIH